jgi:hypothetical protein
VRGKARSAKVDPVYLNALVARGRGPAAAPAASQKSDALVIFVD